MKDFFVSYNRADQPWAEWIAWQLERSGYGVVIQAWDFRQGANFVLDMQRAILDTRRTLLVLSPDFLKSQFTAPEWASAFAQDPTGMQGKLLPVRVRECTPQGLLAQVVYIDLVGLASREEACARLLAGVATGRAKPAEEPGMPVLDPGSASRSEQPDLPEPPWPPSLEVAGEVVSRVFWRLARFMALALVLALLVLTFLRGAMPELSGMKPEKLYFESALWGLGLALGVEALLRVWQRRFKRASAGAR